MVKLGTKRRTRKYFAPQNEGEEHICDHPKCNKKGEFKDKIDWSKLYGELKKGKYRIVKEVYDNGNKIELCAEFTIK